MNQRRDSPCRRVASRLPSQPPSSRPGTSQATVGQSTLPRRWCERPEDRPVKMMLARAVARATCTAWSAGTPRPGSSHTRAATSTRPPPMPSRPAQTPVKAPRARNSSQDALMPSASAGTGPDQAWATLTRMFRILLCLFCLVLAGPAGADDVRPPDLSRQRPAILEAFRLAEQGALSVQDVARISDHPLRGWVEAVNMRRRLGGARNADVRELLRRLAGEPAADWLRSAWLDHLAGRGDWKTFLAEYTPAGNDSETRRCQHLAARLATGDNGEAWLADARALWLTPHSLPDACDAPFKTLQARGGIDNELRWQRLEGALLAGQTGLARWLANGLPAEQATLARSYADFVDEPHDRASGWPRDARSRAVAAEGLARLARRSPDGAETRLAALAPALGLEDAQRARVLYEIALWTVASYLPHSAERLAAVPASAWDERLHEWRVREAMKDRKS